MTNSFGKEGSNEGGKMDYQDWIEGIDGLASLYSFDILEDGSFGEIRLMAVNRKNVGMLKINPNAPEFYPGIPYRNFWMDINFESYVYKCGSTSKPLYSYVNARGVWLKGFYIPIEGIFDDRVISAPEGARTVYCLYLIDYSEQVEAESMMKKSPEVANAVLDIGIRLHGTEDYYEAISAGVKQIRAFCGAEVCSVYTVDRNKQECCFINEYGVQEEFLRSFTSEMGRSPMEVADAWEADLALSDCLLLRNLSVVEERDPAWWKSLVNHDIKNIILYAIRFKQKIVGYMWAANYDVSRMDVIKETMELSTFLLASVIENHQLMDRLEEKSTVDALTQLGNRNAMDELIEGFNETPDKKPEKLGIVFADLNGLKRVNDNEGHDAGDNLIRRAAALLKIVFGHDQIYRAGGDEFVIFSRDTTLEKTEEHVEQLKAMAEKTSDVSFAVGSVYCEGEYDINAAIQEADERMYEDKKAYYASHPDKDRRRRGR